MSSKIKTKIFRYLINIVQVKVMEFVFDCDTLTKKDQFGYIERSIGFWNKAVGLVYRVYFCIWLFQRSLFERYMDWKGCVVAAWIAAIIQYHHSITV